MSVLDCDPHLNDTNELIHELNKTNGLFKFVRVMRGKFQEVAAQGRLFCLASYLVCMPEKWRPFKSVLWAFYKDTHSSNQRAEN